MHRRHAAGRDVARSAERKLRFESLEGRIVLSSSALTPPSHAEPVADAVAMASLSVVDWVRSLSYQQFNQLDAEHVPYLTLQQVASIPEVYWFSRMSSAARGALSPAQVQVLNVRDTRLDFLTAQQISWLTIPQIQSLQLHDFRFLSAAQTPHLTTAQIASIPDPGPFVQWSASARAALTANQIRALNVRDVRLTLLTAQQVSWLTVAQIQSLQLHDFRFLSAVQTPHLTTAQIASIPDPGPFAQWSPAARAALTQTQIQALNVGQVRLTLLTPQQVSWLTIPQIRSLQVADFKFLGPSQTRFLTTIQIAAIPDPGPFAEWSPEARAALTGAQIQALNVGRVRLTLLTPQQIAWLTIPQIQSLQLADFKFLTANQTPFLTTGQIASIPDPGPFVEWRASARAALTSVQIQALNVRDVRLGLLTPQQIAWLSVAQIQSLQMPDFKFLGAAQTPSLTVAQIRLIPDPGPFSEWSPEARGALTSAQIQALDVRNVRLSLLTSQQTSWLTIPQIQSLQLHDFKHLHFAQIPWLSSEQVASIPDHGPLAEWSSLARAALTQWQIPSLNIASLGINWLTSRQIEWLTPTQLAQVRWLDFNLLTPGQIRHLTPDQFASVTDGVILRSFRDELQIQFSRAQLLALPERVLAELMRTLTPPTNYTPTVEIPIGPDGIGQSHHLRMEAERVFDLAPIAAASHVAVSDGDWTDPRTWRNGVVPGAGARVLIPANLSVRFNAVLAPSQAITTLRIDGTLYFARNVATQMYVDTILVNTSGKLHIGTPGAPIASEASARIFITGGGPINAVWDPYLLSRGLISRGEVRMAGREVTPYASLSIAPRKGDTQLVFSQTPVDWRAGDVITLMGTQQHVYGNYSEQLVIRSITGNVVTVDALRYDHLPPEGFGLSVYAVNHSRNIQFAAVDASNPAHRPHMMFLHNPNVVIENISVTGFGRTDKTQPINDPVVVNGALQAGTGTNVRGRYAMHFHHTGVNPAGGVAYVRGSIIEDSPGWGFVNHSSHVVMEYNVTVGVLGAGFVTEDGNEIGVMRGNMALTSLGSGHHIQSRQYNHDFGHGGHGFWLQGPGVSLVDNIAAGHAGGAFVIFTASSVNLFDAVNLDAPSLAAGQLAVPVGTVPFKQISGNVAMTSGNGLEVWFHQTMMPTGRTLIDRFTAWNIRNEGISLHYVGPTTIRNATLVGNMNSFRGTGIAANHITHNILYENVHIEGFEKGIVAPPRRYNRISSAVINATYGIYVEGAHDTLRTLDIAIGIIFRTATPEQLRYQPQFRVYMSGRVDLKFRSLESILAADRIRLVRNFSILSVYYFPEQSSEYVPFTAANTNGYVPDSYLGLTNQQLRQRFGVSLAGEFPAYDAISVLGYRAWVDITPGR